MEFRKYLEMQSDWENVQDDLSDLLGSPDEISDFVYFLRNKGFMPDDFGYDRLVQFVHDWNKSKKKGRFELIYARKRRQKFGPGRFHASSSAGVHTNRSFVHGWRGVNPKNP